ncbi:MAG TPA: anti-sigma factor [Chitinophagaceae bacterium]
MNIQEYISSGIIESYVLGLATPEERAEFEQLCSQYPELVEARNKFEIALEEQATQSSVMPSANSKERIWNTIQQSSASSNTPKIIAMESRPRRRSGLGWVAAASIILFLGTGYLAYTFYNQNKELKKSNSEMAAKIEKSDSVQTIVNDPNATVVNMVGLKGSPLSANIYWDSTSANVYMIVKNMPKLASDKQYQLWALIDNKPVDLGLFDGGEKVILKMNNTQKADAFAITIENRGNTGGPNLPQLQSLGKIKL